MKKLTKTQKIINFVYNNGPSTWTDIQKIVTGCDNAEKIYNSSMRGWGCSGIWKCLRRPARGRHFYISNVNGFSFKNKRRYVVIDNRTGNVKLKKNMNHGK